jgi:uncharacterized protein YbjT (DUF2867 family)
VLLLRDPGKLDADLRDLVDARQGTLDDEAFVRDATAGVDALYWVDPTDFGAEDPNVPTVRLGRVAAAAVRANGIGRVVFQSSVGAEKRHGAGLIDGLAAVEVAAARLLAPDWSGRLVQAVHGPADLTWTSIAETLTAVTGRPFRLEVATAAAARDGMVAAGMSAEAAAGTVEMTSGLADLVPEQPRTVVTTTPTTFGAWAWANLRPALTD